MADGDAGGRYVLLRVDALAPSNMARLVVGSRPICLVHADDGRFYAIEDKCSHEDFALSEGELDGYTVECPQHGSRFDIRTGDALNLPAILPVATFEVEVIDNEVVVEAGVVPLP
jgi:3-phenylpropionate/trans-cinnamate dioxygenase ferredoxin subunit